MEKKKTNRRKRSKQTDGKGEDKHMENKHDKLMKKEDKNKRKKEDRQTAKKQTNRRKRS